MLFEVQTAGVMAKMAGLSQGDIARLVKSWILLDCSEQAYFNNLDNLPGEVESLVAQSFLDQYDA